MSYFHFLDVRTIRYYHLFTAGAALFSQDKILCFDDLGKYFRSEKVSSFGHLILKLFCFLCKFYSSSLSFGLPRRGKHSYLIKKYYSGFISEKLISIQTI